MAALGRAEVLGNGDIDGGLWWASQAQGLITEVQTCADIVDQIVSDARMLITSTLADLVT
jgi:NAD(P)H-dependent flavin oxidoreductase YrpB (nitropropane dioxygenase family)